MSKINIKPVGFCHRKKYCPNNQKSVRISGSQDILILYKQNLNMLSQLGDRDTTQIQTKLFSY